MISYSVAIYNIKKYLKFLAASTNHHGVHSPFVYSLVTKCFYDKSHYQDYDVLTKYRKELSNSRHLLEVTNSSSGFNPYELGKSKKSVQSMLRHSRTSKKMQRLLYRLGAFFKPEHVLELGTHLGMGTTAICLGAKPTQLITVEDCPETANYSQNQFKLWAKSQMVLKNIQTANNFFENFLKDRQDSNSDYLTTKLFDLIYFSGQENGTTLMYYFETLKKYCHEKTVLIISDIHCSLDKSITWTQIIKDPKVSVSIDSYFCGFLFFHPTQAKEHFVIRI